VRGKSEREKQEVKGDRRTNSHLARKGDKKQTYSDPWDMKRPKLKVHRRHASSNNEGTQGKHSRVEEGWREEGRLRKHIPKGPRWRPDAKNHKEKRDR